MARYLGAGTTARGTSAPTVFLFLCVLMNSPLGYNQSQKQVAPLSIAALFVKQQVELKHMDDDGIAARVPRVLLIPGQAWQAAVSGKGTLSFQELHDRSFEVAAETGSWWPKANRQDIYVTASTSLCFGALASVVSNRMHFLALIGLVLFGFSMLSNVHTPTVQYLMCCSAAIMDMHSRYARTIMQPLQPQ